MGKNKYGKQILAIALSFILALGITPSTTFQAAEKELPINTTNFPDENFRAYVKENIDKDKNGSLSKVEQMVTEINCPGQNIKSLKGIEHFTCLTLLNCYDNKLTTLDVSKNKRLWQLWCQNNNIKTLDVTKCKKLYSLDCGNNKLTSLKLKTHRDLRELDCALNKLSTLDVSGCKKLYSLDCSDNRLKKINVTKNTKLKLLYINNNKLSSLNLKNNAKLQYLLCSENALTTLDLSKNPQLVKVSCHSNKITFFDLSQNPLLLKTRDFDAGSQTATKTYTVKKKKVDLSSLFTKSQRKKISISKNQGTWDKKTGVVTLNSKWKEDYIIYKIDLGIKGYEQEVTVKIKR